MTQFTAKAAIPYAELTDAPNMQTYAQGLASSIDGQVIAKYATVTDRNTANPSPTPGDVCYCADTDALYVYIAAAAWIFLYDKTIVKAADTVYTSVTTTALDPHLQFFVEASSKYRFAFTVFTTCSSTTPDMNINFQLPTGASVTAGMIVPSPSGTAFSDHTVNMNAQVDQTSPAAQVAGAGLSASGTTNFIMGMVITSSSGTFGIKNAQNVSSGTSVTVQAHSYVEYSKVG